MGAGAQETHVATIAQHSALGTSRLLTIIIDSILIARLRDRSFESWMLRDVDTLRYGIVLQLIMIFPLTRNTVQQELPEE